MKLLRMALICWVICGVVLFLFGTNLWLLWSLWLVSFGTLLGKMLSAKPRVPEILGLAIAILAVGTIVLRALPVYSLGWGGYTLFTIDKPGENWQIRVTDPGELEALKSYAKRGHYETIQKSGYNYHIYVGDSNEFTSYYVLGDCIGNMPGGFVQSVFVPQKSGFQEFFERVLREHGHQEAR